jgi:hypothetical protein
VYWLAGDKPAHLLKPELVCGGLRDSGMGAMHWIKPPAEEP